jgi:hypothetical protein
MCFEYFYPEPHQHVHLRPGGQSHAPALVFYKAKEGRHVRISDNARILYM